MVSLNLPPLQRKQKKVGSQEAAIPQTTPLSTPPALSIISTPPPNATSKGKSGQALRRGKWTVEEEAYVARVIQDFNSGFLNAPAGTTLRSYLSEKLRCDPMRITKKFTGDACIGKRVFHPAVRSASNAAAIDKAQVRIYRNTFVPLFSESHRIILFATGRARRPGEEMAPKA